MQQLGEARGMPPQEKKLEVLRLLLRSVLIGWSGGVLNFLLKANMAKLLFLRSNVCFGL